MSDHNTTIVSDKTKISLPIKNFIVVCAMLLGAASAWYSLKDGQKETLREIRQMRQEMLPRIEAREWSDEFKELNPGMKVPKFRLRESANKETVNEVAGAPRSFE